MASSLVLVHKKQDIRSLIRLMSACGGAKAVDAITIDRYKVHVVVEFKLGSPKKAPGKKKFLSGYRLNEVLGLYTD